MVKRKEKLIWSYKHDADVTIGETKQKKWPKVLLALLSLSILIGGYFIYVNRWEIYDKITNPEIWLTDEEISIPLNSTFNYEDYIYRKPNYEDRYEYIYPNNGDVNTAKLGSTTLQYKLIRPDGVEAVSELIVNVIDEESPTILLTESAITLTRDQDEFKCEDYIKSVVDNYDKENLINPKDEDKKDNTICTTCLSKIDWSKDSVKVNYIATDSSGNESIETLIITIKDKPKPVETPTPQPIPQPTQQNPSSENTNQNTNTQPTQQTPAQTPNQQPQQQTPQQPQSQAPYINANNCTVRVGDMAALTTCLSSAKSNVTLSVDYSSINMTIPGQYSATYVGEGISKTITVTVVE